MGWIVDVQLFDFTRSLHKARNIIAKLESRVHSYLTVLKKTVVWDGAQCSLPGKRQ
jgi:hypothetical protein